MKRASLTTWAMPVRQSVRVTNFNVPTFTIADRVTRLVSPIWVDKICSRPVFNDFIDGVKNHWFISQGNQVFIDGGGNGS